MNAEGPAPARGDGPDARKAGTAWPSGPVDAVRPPDGKPEQPFSAGDSLAAAVFAVVICAAWLAPFDLPSHPPMEALAAAGREFLREPEVQRRRSDLEEIIDPPATAVRPFRLEGESAPPQFGTVTDKVNGNGSGAAASLPAPVAP